VIVSPSVGAVLTSNFGIIPEIIGGTVHATFGSIWGESTVGFVIHHTL